MRRFFEAVGLRATDRKPGKLRKGDLVWLQGKVVRVTRVDEANNVLTYGPLPWFVRVVRWMLGLPC